MKNENMQAFYTAMPKQFNSNKKKELPKYYNPMNSGVDLQKFLEPTENQKKLALAKKIILPSQKVERPFVRFTDISENNFASALLFDALIHKNLKYETEKNVETCISFSNIQEKADIQSCILFVNRHHEEPLKNITVLEAKKESNISR